jgi:hypothetical protein
VRNCERSQSGLRLAICRPSVTPAWARRPRRRTGTPSSAAGAGARAEPVDEPAVRPVTDTVSPGPSPRLNADRSSGVCRHTTSCRSTSPLPHSAAARAARASTTSRIEADTPSSASDVTRLSGMPHGTM